MTPRIGLYYPYVHFCSDEWVKGAALYWPKVARLVPARYPVADSATVLALADSLDFVVDVDPAPAVGPTSAVLAEAVEVHASALRERAGPGERSRWAPPSWRESPEQVLAGVGALQHDKIGGRLRAALTRANLGGDPRGPVHPDVVWVYLCALAERLAGTHGLEPATDQLAAHAATHGWTADRMAAVLLGRPDVAGDETAARFGVLAVQAVVPRGLAGVPVDKIVRVRRKYGADFAAFHDLVVSSAGELAARCGDGSPEVGEVDGLLRHDVIGRLQRQLADLTAALRSVGLETVLSALTVKVELPPGPGFAATPGETRPGQPVVAGTSAAAFGLATVARSRQVRRAAAVAPPASFLLNVDRTTARGLLKRVLSG